jgi:ornithine cyclodeaminase/alanine dehydrogenase
VDEDTVATLLTPAQALSGVEHAFRLLAGEQAFNEPRHRSHASGSSLNVMWAAAPSLDTFAVKAYPVVKTGVSRASLILVTLFSHSTGHCLGMVQGDLLGQRRTAAATALATTLMARPDSHVLTLFGTGYQAAAQVHAIAPVLPQLRDVLVIGRNQARTASFVSNLAGELPGLRVVAASPESAVRAADVIVTATAATSPLFDGGWLEPGTHVNAIGSNHADHRELDRTAMRRAAQVVVDSRAVAAGECGDILANGLSVSAATELASVVTGQVPGRQDSTEITVFESHGLALQDLVCGRHVLRAAQERGLGQEVSFLRAPRLA